MNLILDDLVQLLATGLIPFIRISAMLLSAPIVSLRVVSVRIRIALAFTLTILIYPNLDIPILDPTSADGIRLIVNEIMIGLIFGMVLQVVNAALVVAGQSISMSMSLGMAQTIDPNMGRVPVVASFLVIISTLIFLSVGGHLILITLILQSFEALPMGARIDYGATLNNLILWAAMVFLGGVLVALPIMISMTLINLCIGIVTRAAPALNIFAVGFPAMVLTGMLLLLVFMVNIGHRIEWLWLQAFDKAQTLWVVP